MTTVKDTQKNKVTTTIKPPPMYAVLLHNDDFTTMDFVEEVLQRFFAMDMMKARSVMLEVHTKGEAICGVYTYDIAQTKVSLVLNFSADHGQPLQCSCRPID
ncbi:ATP-dependent Clp protease adapter ClpS [Brackiella oedipodis]|uniref:ATP-dependent Clp protease adapter ClpS n=1 Tax=Brackiella oedipodis TaxID=124225 RepID=UPI00048E423C|nr:ATP-dependent Clp protease adapter ClpS [Brackiella oedipodis]